MADRESLARGKGHLFKRESPRKKNGEPTNHVKSGINRKLIKKSLIKAGVNEEFFNNIKEKVN